MRLWKWPLVVTLDITGKELPANRWYKGSLNVGTATRMILYTIAANSHKLRVVKGIILYHQAYVILFLLVMIFLGYLQEWW